VGAPDDPSVRHDEGFELGEDKRVLKLELAEVRCVPSLKVHREEVDRRTVALGEARVFVAVGFQILVTVWVANAV
jgi:hypothetical protein